MADEIAPTPARLFRLEVRESCAVPDRNRKRAAIVEELERFGLELVEATTTRRRAVLTVSARHCIPWRQAAVAAAAVPGYVEGSLERVA